MRWKPIVISLLFLSILPIRFPAAQKPQPPSIAAPRSHLALSDFYAHDPFILADPATKTYYLYTAIAALARLKRQAGKTRSARVERCVPMILSGRGFNERPN